VFRDCLVLRRHILDTANLISLFHFILPSIFSVEIVSLEVEKCMLCVILGPSHSHGSCKMNPMKTLAGISVVILMIAAASVIGAHGHKSSKGKSAMIFVGAYMGGPHTVAAAAGKFILCKSPGRETMSDSQASGSSSHSQTSNKERCISMIDLLGIILFLAIIAAHFGLCCRGPYSKLPD
jgi:hypothetical protein